MFLQVITTECTVGNFVLGFSLCRYLVLLLYVLYLIIRLKGTCILKRLLINGKRMAKVMSVMLGRHHLLFAIMVAVHNGIVKKMIGLLYWKEASQSQYEQYEQLAIAIKSNLIRFVTTKEYF